ncbi:Stress responsive protein [Phaffia rhodozyma]|uniref:Stress responsive protein n=1 Tax=Phaffia rhodozyma TaxID=264483 RepID=A0A0F7SGH4_PHARH|nr:Stress responsive protein [Phaffia rhodozyma]
MEGADLLLVILAIFFPPGAVLATSGCGCDLLLNIILTFLAYIPGVIHAIWIVYKKAQANEKYGKNNYIYVGNGHFQPGPHAYPGQVPVGGPAPYGSHQAAYAPGQGQTYIQSSGVKH